MWFGPRPSLPTTPVLRSWLYSHLKSHLSTEQSSLPFLPEKRKYPIPRVHQLGNVTPYTKQSSVREIQHPTFCQARISFLSASCLFIIFCSFTSRSQTSFGGPLLYNEFEANGNCFSFLSFNLVNPVSGSQMRLQNHSSCVLTTQLLSPLGDEKESFIVTVTHSTLECRWPSYHSSKTPPLPWYLPVVFAPSTDKDAAPARVALGCFWEDWSICPHQKALLSLVTHSMSVHTDKFSEEKTGYMPVQLQCFETLSPCMSAIDPPSLVSLVSFQVHGLSETEGPMITSYRYC